MQLHQDVADQLLLAADRDFARVPVEYRPGPAAEPPGGPGVRAVHGFQAAVEGAVRPDPFPERSAAPVLTEHAQLQALAVVPVDPDQR